MTTTIHNKHMLQAGLTNDEALGATAFIFRFDGEKDLFTATLPLGDKMASNLYDNVGEAGEIKKIFLEQKGDRHGRDYELVQRFYRRMVKYFTQKEKVGDSLTTTEKEDKVLDEMAKQVTERFSRYIRKRTPPVFILEKLTDYTLRSLDEALVQCKDKSELMRIICRHVTELEQLHPFKSANGRTFTLLMQYLLMVYGLPPGAFESPESFLCCGQDRLAADLEAAVAATRKIISEGAQPGFNLHGFETPEDDIEYLNACASLHDVIHSDLMPED